MKIEDYITINPRICHGQPCFKGTRIMVYLVLELLEAGETPEQILKSYPSVSIDSIKAALHFAAELIKTEEYSSLLPQT
ncbi:MAG: DUF433 domain-containing protein [Elusimicrobia bacterium]|nr:DUF433 domain-containing protein [Elusimicrobiota bacterium]